MTGKANEDTRLLGILRTEDGAGVVRIEDRYDTDIDDLWSALTDPDRLARWMGIFEGDLRLGGEYRARYFAGGWEGTGRVEVCEAPQRLRVVGTEDGHTNGHVTEITLRADGDQTILVLEGRGMPADMVAAYGAGIQVHVEDLAAYVAGGERCDSDARMEVLYPAYQNVPITHS